MRKTSIKIISAFLVALAFLAISLANKEGERSQLQLRTYVRPFRGSDSWVEARFEQTIMHSRTAIIITDMWDKHWCAGATGRVKQIALKMKPTLNEARRAGILIVHAAVRYHELLRERAGCGLKDKICRLRRINLPASLSFKFVQQCCVSN